MWDPTRTPRLGLVKDFPRSFAAEDYVPGLPFVFGHHKDEQSWEASRRQGCTICAPHCRASAWAAGSLKKMGFFSVFHLALHRLDHGEGPRVVLNLDSRIACTLIPFQDCLSSPGFNFNIGDETGDERTWRTIENWLARCRTTHGNCARDHRRSAASKSFRPTRLLELTTDHKYRLVMGDHCQPALQYAALSHCWGQQDTASLLMLAQSTAPSLQNGQPISSLPKTFRDASVVARRLGVNYLWIDRLCIFQDDASDWQREAATMCDVYRHAYFSIAALGARNSDGGASFGGIRSSSCPRLCN
ncbi:heterokaryon incompatibility protein-domain-containing protein [Microdochium trichocladiopsis]|uniref:Heterokaryon incompatibility protein-domain-containing protein n=1 Tax=Microdochium trichocladiopsis TaxID=1682393 RepID=A0A9P8XSH4_9PEZI|nr:heterokaryon incompatibility protein-domain-containing protein [Microdochium trichocladiopsis]KAH7014588.1 heterokaryon incompatibility protein-domain-containing protein [Microdochium trichocladiopsis]